MARDDEQTEKEAPAAKFKLNLSAYWLAFQEMPWKDPKKIAIALAALFIITTPVRWMFSSGSGGRVSEQVIAEARSQAAPAIAYVTLTNGKATEFMATIDEDDKILTFAAVLGLEKEDLREDVEMTMAPLLSEVLRFLSDKSRQDILDMIQDEEGRERGRLLNRLNQVLVARGVNLEAKGMVVSISFTRYFFPPL